MIYDIIRKKYVVINPEEWVRQQLIHYLIKEIGYPKGRMAVEKQLSFNQLTGRADILVFDREFKPWMILECKAPEVKLRQDTFDQAARYNIELSAPYLVICNGEQLRIAEVDFVKRQVSELNNWPAYPEDN